MSPPYIFRIDEIGPNPNVGQTADAWGWIPSIEAHANIRVGGGVSGQWWLCNTQQISPLQAQHLPQNRQLYSCFSIYYSNGRGLLVLDCDAANPTPGKAWRNLQFEHDSSDYTSYLTNAGEEATLFWQRPDQKWPRMLLPDIYHAPSERRTENQAYGGLKGDLAILLGLIALSLRPERLREYLPQMFVHSKWRTHNRSDGRTHQRGVVVYIYLAPSTWFGGSTPDDMVDYENGDMGKYYD